MSKDDEKVLCVRRDDLDRMGLLDAIKTTHGFYGVGQRELDRAIKTGTFIRRGLCETDPSYLQIIPYVVFRYLDSDKPFFVYRRSAKSGEDRLQAKYSLGIGGHIGEADSQGDLMNKGAFACARDREIKEEVKIACPWSGPVFKGFIQNDDDFVGQVHLGALLVADLQGDEITPADDSIDEHFFESYDWLLANYAKLERWSQIVITSKAMFA